MSIDHREHNHSIAEMAMEDIEVHGDDEGYDSSLSFRRSATADNASLSMGDSRSSFETESKSDISPPDINQNPW